jgi:GntR family transcriptional regulator
LANQEHADLLGVEPGSSLLAVERTAYDAEHVPVEYSLDLFRADRIRLLVRSQLIPESET